MTEIIPLLACLSQYIDGTTLRQLNHIVQAMLVMTGRTTMLGISRWSDKGGSYRTVQRFFNRIIPWCKLHWFFIRSHLLDKSEDEVILISGDETTVTKSGKETHGLDRFFSSILGKTVCGISFFCLSLISVKHRSSSPVVMEQVIKEKKPQEESAAGKQPKKKAKKGKNRVGRPKGSKNKNRRDLVLSPHLLWMQALIRNLLQLIGGDISVAYFLYDGALGNNNGLQMVKQCGLHLISKLRYDAALWFPYEGPYSGRGNRKKYGTKLQYGNIPEKYLKDSSTQDGIRTDIYQITVWNKNFADQLNVVVIVKTKLKTGTNARVVLFSSDLDLSWVKLIDYYRLRFQIEFNFRDAKQYWGLEDFMNVNKTPVSNGANLAMFMVNLSQALLRQFQGIVSVNDLKTRFHGYKLVDEVLKLLPEKPESIFIQRIYTTISSIGRINGQVSTT